MGGLDGEVFVPGRLVLVKRGSCAGKWCVVLGVDRDGRVLVADGRSRSARRPKRKNPRHLQPSGVVIEEVASLLSQGSELDDGRLSFLIAAVIEGIPQV
jgi:ribosomal protein L24